VIDYVLPIRCDERDEAHAPQDHDALLGYLHSLRPVARVIVADGSPPEMFEHHAARFAQIAVHVPVDPTHGMRNGKVAGVHAGMRHALSDRVVIADDDVRHTPATLRELADDLRWADLVIPQNVFPGDAPWHARWDMARTLLQRTVGPDAPGTLAIRRSTFLAMGGYDGDVLFENLELIRTVAAAGGTIAKRPDLYVTRLPPSTQRFFEQRVRQAYDEFARPMRLGAALLVVPAIIRSLRRGRGRGALGAAIAIVAIAEIGRRRHGGAARFPRTAPLYAPGWVLERGITAWLAVASRVLLGGCRYRGDVIPRAGTPPRVLRRRLRGRLRASHRTAASSGTGHNDTAGSPPAGASRPSRPHRPARRRPAPGTARIDRR
jgi:hypothetical protein